jgi:hypothetical protein
MDREHIRLVDQLSKEPEDGNLAILAGVGVSQHRHQRRLFFIEPGAFVSLLNFAGLVVREQRFCNVDGGRLLGKPIPELASKAVCAHLLPRATRFAKLV